MRPISVRAVRVLANGVRHVQDPANHPAPPRLQWHCYKSGRIKMLRGLSRWQLPILTAVDRSGMRLFERIANTRRVTIHAALSPVVAKDAVLCSDPRAGLCYLRAIPWTTSSPVVKRRGEARCRCLPHPERERLAFTLQGVHCEVSWSGLEVSSVLSLVVFDAPETRPSISLFACPRKIRPPGKWQRTMPIGRLLALQFPMSLRRLQNAHPLGSHFIGPNVLRIDAVLHVEVT